MCGIVGIFDLHNKRAIDQSLLKKMNDSQTHRGPDESGLFFEPGIGLGHKRLSIIDISTGKQPLFNEDKTVVVIYNGEIYNFREIRKELINFGHIFRTNSDTEIIVHAWEQWGESCVNKFRGMFSFAIWDKNKQVLFLARDRLGIKPLYYGILSNGLLIFSSELKALLAHPDLNKDIDPTAIDDYFSYGYIPDPKSIFKDIHKLSPGHFLIVAHGHPTPVPTKYWDIPFIKTNIRNENDVAHELIERIEDAVRIRLISEVPLGAFLSGGVDSSTIAAVMARLNDNPINTCSISFKEKQFNESDYARQVSKLYGTNHNEQLVSSENELNLIDKIISIYDEPFADNSALPTYILCQLARQKVTVALSGDGGDEIFGGYETYKYHLTKEAIRSVIPSFIRKPIFGSLGKLYPKADWAPRYFRAKTTFETLACNSVESFARSAMINSPSHRLSIYSSSFRKVLQDYDPVDHFRFHASNSPTDEPLSLAQYLDMKTYLPGDILTKVDRASMANSLEVRVPLLDHQLVEWVSNLPTNMKLQNNEGKYILKKAFEPYLPNDILYRKKMGFDIPLSLWLKGPLKEHIYSILNDIEKYNIFNKRYLNRIFEQHISGKSDHSGILWPLLIFYSFMKNI